MAKKYRVLFYGLSGNNEVFRSRMMNLGVSPEAVEQMIRKAPIILKEGLTQDFSTRYADAVRNAGGLAEIQEQGLFEEPEKNHMIPIASFKDFTMCPQCGLKQQKSVICIRCGYRLVKMENGLEPRNVAGH